MASSFLFLTIPAIPPANGDVLSWNATNGDWEPTTIPSGLFAAGGDLSGSNTDQTVIAIQGHSVSSSAPSLNQVFVWTGSAWVPTTLSASELPNLSGDVSGAINLTVVQKLQGFAISSATPTLGQILELTGSAWTPSNLPISLPPNGPAGGDLGSAYPNPTVIALQGNKIQSGTLGSLQDGYILTWKNSDGYWEAKPAPSGFMAGKDLSGTATSQTVIALQGNAIKPGTLGSSQDGYVLTWKNSDGYWEAEPSAIPAITATEIAIGTGSSITGYASSSLSNAGTDFIALGDISANLPTSGFLRLPALSGGGATAQYLTIGNPSANIVWSQYGSVYFGSTAYPTVMIGGGTSVLQSGAYQLGIQTGQFYISNLNVMSIAGSSSFAFVQGTVGGSYRFPSSGSGGALQVGTLTGDPTTSSPLQMGVSISHAIGALSGTASIVLSSAEYTNQIVRFTGTAASGLALTITMPAIVGGASGYALLSDFSLCTMASISSLTFKVGSTTYAVSAPTANVGYTVSWDGTTLSALVMAKA
jgi:hypothetical protein